MKVQIFKDGTETIRKDDVDVEAKTIVIPASVKTIEKGAFHNIAALEVLYTGTREQVRLINFNDKYALPSVICCDGLEIFGL